MVADSGINGLLPLTKLFIGGQAVDSLSQLNYLPVWNKQGVLSYFWQVAC